MVGILLKLMSGNRNQTEKKTEIWYSHSQVWLPDCSCNQSNPGWWYTYPSEKYEFVSWDYYSQYMGMGQNLLLWILVGWTSIYQLFWGLLGTRVLTHSHMEKQKMFHKPPSSNRSLPIWSNCDIVVRSSPERSPASTFFFFFFSIS